MLPHDIEELRAAKRALEHPSFAARITNAIGAPLEQGFALLPQSWAALVSDAARAGITTALNVALKTLSARHGRSPRDLLHKAAVAATGAGAGMFGLPALPVELPVSTTIMLRSIGDIARSQGEDLRTLNARLACLEVFALGGTSPRDDATETGYFAVRAALAGVVSDVATYIAERGLAKEGAPPLVRLVVYIAERFGVQVSEKLAAQAVPVIGAAGGAAVNLLFIDHFQRMAKAHFTVRRLERKYGAGAVRQAYEELVV